MRKICGIYLIRCGPTGKSYIGSSRDIGTRWGQHRSGLRRGISVCRGLQGAWNKYGEDAFTFHILEECGRDSLEPREQHYIDTLRPALNMVRDTKRHVSDEHIQKLVALNRARLLAVTHCPRRHAYDEANTYISKKGKRICRACNALRIAAIYAKQSPEEKAQRLARNLERNRQNKDRPVKQLAYRLAHKAEKREYDRLYHQRKSALFS